MNLTTSYRALATRYAVLARAASDPERRHYYAMKAIHWQAKAATAEGEEAGRLVDRAEAEAPLAASKPAA